MKTQPSFGKFLPVAVMIGVAAALVVYLSVNVFASMYPWAGAVWVIFISWALYFMAGAKVSRIPKYVLGLVGGVVFGLVTLMLMSNVFAPMVGAYALPVTVFFVATAIVLLELTNLFELAPAYFFGYATYFAYVFNPNLASTSNAMDVVYVSVLLLVGVLVGYITATLRAKILDMERVPFELRDTIFDKEN